MRLPKQQDLSTLFHASQEELLSIVMPTSPMQSDGQKKDSLVLKNLLKDVEQQLEQRDSKALTRAHLKPLYDLLEDGYFWANQRQGLAIYLSAEGHELFSLPFEPAQLALLDSRFYLPPLVRYLNDEAGFYLLALSQNEVRFFEGSRAGLEQLDVADLPLSLEDGLWYEDPELRVQVHTSEMATVGGQGQTMVHGHHPESEHKDRLLRFFGEIDTKLRPYLADSTKPLLLAGVQYLQPIYREASSYDHIAEVGVDGNFDGEDEAMLHELAWEALRPRRIEKRQRLISAYEANQHNGETADSLTESVKMALQGRVDTLLAANNMVRWGEFAPEQNHVVLTDDGNIELVNAAVFETLRYGGEVLMLDDEQMPEGKTAVAILRA